MMEKEDIPRLEAGEDIKVDLNFDTANAVRRKKYPFFVFLIINKTSRSAYTRTPSGKDKPRFVHSASKFLPAGKCSGKECL